MSIIRFMAYYLKLIALMKGPYPMLNKGLQECVFDYLLFSRSLDLDDGLAWFSIKNVNHLRKSNLLLLHEIFNKSSQFLLYSKLTGQINGNVFPELLTYFHAHLIDGMARIFPTSRAVTRIGTHISSVAPPWGTLTQDTLPTELPRPQQCILKHKCLQT